MSNVLKVTTPLGGYEKTRGVRKGESSSSAKGGSKTTSSRPEVSPLCTRFESNYGSFIRHLQAHEKATSQMGVSGLADRLGETIEVEAEALKDRLVTEGKMATVFSDKFFAGLRVILEEEGSWELKGQVLDFLRRYGDMTETARLLKGLEQILKDIEGNLYLEARTEWGELVRPLCFEEKGILYQETLTRIKEQVLPFLNLYIARMNERGRVRDLASLLSKILGRLENGYPTRVEEAFEQLFNYKQIVEHYGYLEGSSILAELGINAEKQRKKKQKWIMELGTIVKEGIKGEGSKEHQRDCEEILRSVLLGASVYLPLVHSMMPMRIHDRFLFAQTWVNPDGCGSYPKDNEKKDTKLLTKFVIPDLGNFELFVYSFEGRVRLQLSLPKKLANELEKIRKDLRSILSESKMEILEFVIEKEQKSISLREAFPEILEKENSINVAI